MGNTFYFDFEPALMMWLQKFLGETGIGLISHFSAFGEAILIIVLSFLYWCYDKRFGRFVMQNTIIGLVLNGLIKNVALRRRPYFDHEGIECYRPVEKGEDINDIAAQGFSFPSAHSMNSTIVYGSIARYVSKKLFVILAMIIPILVGISRVVVGVHYPTDVMVGWLLGTIIVFTFPVIYKKVGKAKRPIVNLVIFLVCAIGFFYCKTTDYYTGMGVMAGFYLATEFEERFVNFEETKQLLEILLRMALGFAIYALLNKLLKLPFSSVFLSSDTMASFVVRFFRYAIITFILIGVYPMLFKLFNKLFTKNKVGEINERA